MRYIITTKGELQILEIIGYNIFFGWDMSDDYEPFRNALTDKGIDAFVDLLIQDSNTAFLIFTNGY